MLFWLLLLSRPLLRIFLLFHLALSLSCSLLIKSFRPVPDVRLTREVKYNEGDFCRDCVKLYKWLSMIGIPCNAQGPITLTST